MEDFHLEIITPQRSVYNDKIEGVSVPTGDGTIQILANHEPLFTLLTQGEIKIFKEKKEYFLAIGGGFLEVFENKVEILVTKAMHADELNEAEIKKAHEMAKELLKQKPQGQDYLNAQVLLRQTLVELKTLRRVQRKGSAHSLDSRW